MDFQRLVYEVAQGRAIDYRGLGGNVKRIFFVAVILILFLKTGDVFDLYPKQKTFHNSKNPQGTTSPFELYYTINISEFCYSERNLNYGIVLFLYNL